MTLTTDQMTISYKQIASIPIGPRERFAQSGLANIFAAALTPSQRASLFPKYYKDVASLGVAPVSTQDLPSVLPSDVPILQKAGIDPTILNPKTDPPKTTFMSPLNPTGKKDSSGFMSPLNPTGTKNPSSSPTTSGKPNMSEQEIRDYIRKAAISRGIDPDIAIQVAESEGLNTVAIGPGRQTAIHDPRIQEYDGHGDSWGPYQLYMGKGLGKDFQNQTGLDPRNPQTTQQQIDFSLDHAAKHGWSDWQGWKGDPYAGITSDSKPIGISAISDASAAPIIPPKSTTQDGNKVQGLMSSSHGSSVVSALDMSAYTDQTGKSPMDYAKTMLGSDERTDTDKITKYLNTGKGWNNLNPSEVAWCAAFMNSSLEKAGIKGTGTLWAPDFNKWGQSVKPTELKPGDIGVLPGHVGMVESVFTGKDGKTYVQLLGGNQGSKPGENSPTLVSEKPVPIDDFVSFRTATTDQLINPPSTQVASAKSATLTSSTPTDGNKFISRTDYPDNAQGFHDWMQALEALNKQSDQTVEAIQPPSQRKSPQEYTLNKEEALKVIKSSDAYKNNVLAHLASDDQILSLPDFAKSLPPGVKYDPKTNKVTGVDPTTSAYKTLVKQYPDMLTSIPEQNTGSGPLSANPTTAALVPSAPTKMMVPDTPIPIANTNSPAIVQTTQPSVNQVQASNQTMAGPMNSQPPAPSVQPSGNNLQIVSSQAISSPTNSIAMQRATTGLNKITSGLDT